MTDVPRRPAMTPSAIRRPSFVELEREREIRLFHNTHTTQNRPSYVFELVVIVVVIVLVVTVVVQSTHPPPMQHCPSGHRRKVSLAEQLAALTGNSQT